METAMSYVAEPAKARSREKLGPEIIRDAWAEAVAAKADKWEKAVQNEEIGKRWAEGLAIYGIKPSEAVRERYVRRVRSDIAAKKYRAKVTSPEVAEKYLRRYIEGLTGS